MVGRTLGGRYIVEERVGGGGMATVYRGVDTFLRRQVALKVLRGQFAGDAQFVARFRREARAAAMLSHPNIVAVYDVGQQDDDCYYIVQEFIDGRTLKERIAAEGAVEAPEALRVVLQVLAALGRAHATGVIHRDIKPQNVLLTADGEVKVTDFGIARAEAGVTMAHSGAIVGTAHYAAPEQVRGQRTDERCDIYSTGVLLYEMLTGQVPYDGEGPLAIALQHVQDPVPDPAAVRPDLPPGACAIVRHALAKAPDDRYQSTGEFEADVEDVVAGRVPALAGTAPAAAPVPAAPPAAPGGPARGAPRRRGGGWLRAFGAAVGLVLGLGILGSGGVLLGMHLLAVPTVSVPQVAGDGLAAAQQALNHARLAYVVDQQYDGSVPEQAVIRTVPAAGSAVRAGYQVEIWQSLGPAPATVPPLAGLSPQAASAELSGLGLQVQLDPTPQFSATVEAGAVMASVPGSGAQVQGGSTVTLTLSAGPADTGGLPDYIGQQASAVETDITSHQWTVGATTQQLSGWPLGAVVATGPAAGTPMLTGAGVALTISSGCVYQQALSLTAATFGPQGGTPAAASVPDPAAPAATAPGSSGGVVPGTPGFSSTGPAPQSSSASSSAGPASSASPAAPSSSSTAGAGPATSSASASGPPLGMLETVSVSDAGQAGAARQEYQQTVSPGTVFTVQLCWASPQGATYTWQENGITRQIGNVTATTAPSSVGSATGPAGQQTAGAVPGA